MKYWIIVASKDHVKNGINEGIAQACHGKSGPLKKMEKGDFVIYYSSKLNFGEVEKCQNFTSIGIVADNEVYEFQMNENFKPARRNIDYLASNEVSILPLINDLEFILDKKRWGYPFRYGFLQINKTDFDLISSKMLIK